MKKINKYIALGLGALTLASCESLDTKYQGYYVTAEQKQEVLELNPSMALAGVTGCAAAFSNYETVYAQHFDFGYPSIMIGLDLQGVDMVCDNSGYNWFSYWEAFSSPTPNGTPSSMAWYHLYDQIYACNSVAATIDEDTDDNQLMFYRAQAMAIRAFDYWVLAQTYQFNYKGNESKPCVPIVTEKNTQEAAENGNPRATVQAVYDQILSDLDGAIDFLTKTTLTPEQVIDSKPKRLVSLATAYGLRARVYLTMHEYAKAAADAQNAISAFGGQPYSIAEVSVPTFTSLDDHAWMWGVAISENDRVVTSGIVNWPSMVVTFCGNGYVSVGAWKYCNSLLYNQISRNDVRKGWFLDENLTSPNLSKQQQNYINEFGDDMFPYTNVKFNSYQGVVGQSTNANDIPLMRIEEMYYILAEAQAMSGNVQGGVETFKNFVTTYRNPSLSIQDEASLTPAQAQELIYQDRRVEFWGEGLSYFDLMRLNKGVDRRGSNYPAAFTFNIDPTYGCLIYCIPQGEINGNPGISNSDNNDSVDRPSPAL